MIYKLGIITNRFSNKNIKKLGIFRQIILNKFKSKLYKSKN